MDENNNQIVIKHICALCIEYLLVLRIRWKRKQKVPMYEYYEYLHFKYGIKYPASP